ncbi:hypothetical protein BN2364_2615 [Alloalcanivorax xenomutans]|jgi:hypothetical protein|nr:hypothetical protein BN2364_2615 [Alloalcanivorax xenomutans]|tara:strand:+ start:416 stop:661 length:246 start_codon:yes stop_codon:yes gene_type:complete
MLLPFSLNRFFTPLAPTLPPSSISDIKDPFHVVTHRSGGSRVSVGRPALAGEILIMILLGIVIIAALLGLCFAFLELEKRL